MMKGLLVAQGEEAAELGLGADRPELTKVNQTATLFPILPGFQFTFLLCLQLALKLGLGILKPS